jgi:hypothetical protein
MCLSLASGRGPRRTSPSTQSNAPPIKGSVEHVQAQASGAIANVLLRGGSMASAAEAVAKVVKTCK